MYHVANRRKFGDNLSKILIKILQQSSFSWKFENSVLMNFQMWYFHVNMIRTFYFRYFLQWTTCSVNYLFIAAAPRIPDFESLQLFAFSATFCCYLIVQFVELCLHQVLYFINQFVYVVFGHSLGFHFRKNPDDRMATSELFLFWV